MSRNKMFKESASGNLLRDVRIRAAMTESIMAGNQATCELVVNCVW